MRHKKAEMLAEAKERATAGRSPLNGEVMRNFNNNSNLWNSHMQMMEQPALFRQISNGANSYLGEGYRALEEVISEMRYFKKIVKRSLKEYFETTGRRGSAETGKYASNTFEKFERTLRELNLPNYHHEIVKSAFSLALDMGSKERRLVNALLKKCVQRNLIEDSDVQHGLAVILGRLDDLKLDVPNVKKIAVDIFSQAISDEVLSAELVKREEQLEYGGSTGIDTLRDVLHRTPEYSRKIWGGSGDQGAMQREIDYSIFEYFDSYDMEEVARIFGELHLNKEGEVQFIERIVLLSIESDRKGKKIQLGLNLLHYLKDIFWSELEIEMALDNIRSNTPDIVLDVPKIN